MSKVADACEMPRCCNDNNKAVSPVSGVTRRQQNGDPEDIISLSPGNRSSTIGVNHNDFEDDNHQRHNHHHHHQINQLQNRDTVVEKSHRRLRCDLSPVPTSQNTGLSIKLLGLKVSLKFSLPYANSIKATRHGGQIRSTYPIFLSHRESTVPKFIQIQIIQ